MKSALAVMAIFLGQSEALKIETLGYEQENIQVLVDTGMHIELGIKADSVANTDTTSQTGALSEMK
jgi:hypothetical protein